MVGTNYPNLSPYTPPGWTDKIVVSTTTNTTADSAFLSFTNTLYIDWAVLNDGSVPTPARYYTELYVDEVLRRTWFHDPPFNPNAGSSVLDYSIGSLGSGVHSLRIKVDTRLNIAEGNEGDNEYVKAIYVNGPMILSPTQSGADFTFSFATIAGRTYVVQYKNSLDDPVWQTLQSVVGDGTVKTVTDSISAVSQRFYRLSVQ